MDHQVGGGETHQTLLDDIREARVRNGVDLEQVAVRSRIPAALIEELERGELSRWPRALYGRTQLVRYARAAGLDPNWVVGVVTPMLDEPGPAVPLTAQTRPRSDSDGQIAIIASSFDKDEELFASEDGGPQPAAPTRAPASAPRPREEAARVPSGGARLRAPIAPRPRPTSSTRTTGRRRVQPSRLTETALAVSAALLCGAALWSYAPRPQPKTEARAERPAVTTSTVAVAPATRPHSPPHVDAPKTETRPDAQPIADVDSSPSSAPSVEPPPATPAGASVDQPVARTEPAPAAAPPASQEEHGSNAESPREPSAPAASEPSTRLTAAHPAEGLSGDAVMFSPSFSASGEAIYFQRESGKGSALMRADTDDGRVVRVARVVDDGARNFHVRPSPTGGSIAFDSDRDGTRAVYVAQADGRQPKKVSGTGYAAVPSWAPDGRSLVFVRAEPGQPSVWNLWQLTLASGDLRRLTSYRVGQPWGASWFPDGRRVAYSHETALVILDLQTGLRQVYESPRAARLVRTPAVSPSGNEILFQVFHDGVWLLNVASGAMHRVLDDASAEEYAWSPDGRQVAYHSRRSGHWGLWVASVD